MPKREGLGAQSSGTKNQLLKLLRPLSETLYSLSMEDQRYGAKMFYNRQGFLQASREYLASVNSLRDSWTPENFNHLRKAASEFVAFVQQLFPNDRSRMLTTLRQNVGGSFTSLYKNSILVIKLTEFGFSEETSLEPITLPDQQASPIYTKIEADRVVLDVGHPLHPFLRKEGVDETRRYLRKELFELSEALQVSNIDRKYVESFAKLNELISFKDDAGAISFGLHVRLISHLTKSIEQELSEILVVRIASTLTHSAYFASQYKDWVEFLRNAENYPSRRDVESEIDAALVRVADLLMKTPESVDERIPESIQFIVRMLKGGLEDRMGAIYAGVRGVENICIATIRYAYDQALLLLQDAGKKARPTLVRIGAVAIIGIALAVISNFMPVIRSASELSWILENLPRIEMIGRILK